MVNVEVDEGIEPVVAALSLFPMLATRESCQGFIDKRNPRRMSAGVHFEYGTTESVARSDWRLISAFVLGFLAPELWKRVNDDAYASLEFRNGNSYTAILGMRTDSIQSIAQAIRDIHSQWEKQGCKP